MVNCISPDLLRGNTDAIILHLLSLRDSYGYEIYKAIIEITGEQFELKEATLYASFKRLTRENFISSYWATKRSGEGENIIKSPTKGETSSRNARRTGSSRLI